MTSITLTKNEINLPSVAVLFVMNLGMVSVSDDLDMSLESRVFVSMVSDDACSSIRLDKGVVAADVVTITFLRLRFDVSSVVVRHSIVELVLRVGL